MANYQNKYQQDIHNIQAISNLHFDNSIIMLKTPCISISILQKHIKNTQKVSVCVGFCEWFSIQLFECCHGYYSVYTI